MERNNMINNFEGGNAALENKLAISQEKLIENCDEVSEIILSKDINTSAFNQNANLIMSRLVSIIPDSSKLSKMDGRVSPLASEVGHSVAELFQHLQSQLAHADAGNIKMVLGALFVQFLTFHMGAKNADKFSAFINNLKSKLNIKNAFAKM
jgi:hypothetical protein